MASYRELIVWQKAMELVEEVYRLSKLLPREETYALSDQMRRAVVSVPSNIAEGHGRNYEKEFLRFLSIAQGSRAELDTQIEICIRLKYIDEEQVVAAQNLSNEVGKMLRKMIQNLKLGTTN